MRMDILDLIKDSEEIFIPDILKKTHKYAIIIPSEKYSNTFIVTPKKLSQSRILASLQSKILQEGHWTLPTSGTGVYHYILFDKNNNIPTYIFFTEGTYKGQIPIKQLKYWIPSSEDDVKGIENIAYDIIIYLNKVAEDPQSVDYITYMKKLLKKLRNYYETILEIN